MIYKSEFVDAPLIDELPMAVECRLVSYDPENCRLVGEIVNVSADESVLDENDKIVQSAQAQVGGTSFSLKTLDDQIHFGELPTGCYTYMVIVTESSGETLCFASDFTVSDAATSTATYWSVQDPDGTKLTDQTITATAEETIQSTLGWLSGLFG